MNNVPLGYISSKDEQFQNCFVTKGEHFMNIKEAKKYLDYIKYEQMILINTLQDAYAIAKEMKFNNDDERIIWLAEYVYDQENSTAY